MEGQDAANKVILEIEGLMELPPIARAVFMEQLEAGISRIKLGESRRPE